MGNRHNHVTRDIKPPGQCPGCDEYHRSREEGHRAEPASRGESGIRGESSLSRERALIAQQLEALGHGGCAFDLEAADDEDVVDVAYSIVEHLEENCGAPRDEDQDVAVHLKDWADRYERR